MIYLLDTHTWIWWNMNPYKLSQRVKGLIGNAEMYDEILLSAISPWEFSKLLEKRRRGISCNPEDWIISALEMVYGACQNLINSFNIYSIKN